MALPLLAFAAGGSLLSILGGMGNNKAVERAKRRAIAAAGVKATQLHERLGKQVGKATGASQVSQAERGSFGAGAKRLQLAILAEGLTEESNIEMTEFLEIGQIESDAASRKTNLFSAGLSGAMSGLSLGSRLGSSSFFGKSTVEKSTVNPAFSSTTVIDKGLTSPNPFS